MAITFLTNEDKNILDGQINKNAEDIGRLSEEIAELKGEGEGATEVSSNYAIVEGMISVNKLKQSVLQYYYEKGYSRTTISPVAIELKKGETVTVSLSDISNYRFSVVVFECPSQGNNYSVDGAIKTFPGTYTYISDTGWLTGASYTYKSQSDLTAISITFTKHPDNGYSFTDEDSAEIQRLLSIKIGAAEEETVTNDVFSRNSEVLPMIHAAAHHGHSVGGEWNVDHQFTMMVTTDVHGDEVRFKSALDYMDGVDQFDVGISLGDMQPGYFNDNDGTWFTTLVNGAKKPIYPVIGNHDAGNTDDTTKSATKAQQFAKFFQPILSKIGMPDLTKTYYSVDTGHGVTMIVLDTHDVPDTMSGGKFAVSRGVVGFSQTQIDWLIATLQGIPADGHVLIAGHTLADAITDVDCPWTQEYTEGAATNDYPNMIPEIVNAWQNGVSLSKTYTPVVNAAQATIQVNADFTSRGEGVFAGFVFGHWHKDVVAKMVAYPTQNVIRLASTSLSAWQNEAIDLPRVEGMKSEDCVTALSVDTITRKVKLVRIGSNITFDMVRRDMIAIPY